MCGILGYTHIHRQLSAGVLENALTALRHRGPNQAGSFCSPHASLGATRLSIVDLENGSQPMHSADGSTTVVFNGEIYNHRQLRQELEALGARFRTHCDTEVVLEAWLHWGTASFARLRGMFAIALWNEPTQRLVLARDRMGIKPLYYMPLGEDLDFASELKCIFADPLAPRTIDLAGLNCYLSLNYVPGPYTLVSGLSKLMPGCLLDWQKGHFSIHSYVPRPARSESATLPEACDELDRLLEASISEQLASDVPLGLWLSGGLDSSSVLHYAARHSSKPLKTFSVTFHGKSFDESRYIHDVATQYGADHTEFDLSPQEDLAEVISGLAYYSDEPSADAGAIPVWYLSRMTRQAGVTTILSGEGADELFGGYLTYKADRYRQVIEPVPSLFKKAALRCARALPASNEKIGLDYKLQRFLAGSVMSPEAAHVYWNGTFTEEEKRHFFHFADAAPMRALLGSMRPGRALERYLDFDRRYSLPDGILYKVDRMSMAHAIEVRPPFLDDRIVDFATQLPRRFKISGRETKLVLRRLMRSKLPVSVLQRPKTGFDIPIHEWFRGPLRPLLLDTLSETELRNSHLFDAAAVGSLIGQHLDQRANWGYHLWGLMTLLIWMKRWKIEVPETAPHETFCQDQVFVPAPSLTWQPANYTVRVSEAQLA